MSAELEEGKLSPLQSKLLSVAGVKDSPIVPLIIGDELFEWARKHEEEVLGHSVKVLSLSGASLERPVENAVQFGITIFLTGFTGSIPAVILPALEGHIFKAGCLEMVRIGDSVVEFSPDFRRYLVAGDPAVQVEQELEQKIERIELPRTVLQIGAEMDSNGLISVSCTTLGGAEVATLQLPGTSVTIGQLIRDAASASGLEPLGLVLAFPNGTSSRTHPRDTMLAKIL